MIDLIEGIRKIFYTASEKPIADLSAIIGGDLTHEGDFGLDSAFMISMMHTTYKRNQFDTCSQ